MYVVIVDLDLIVVVISMLKEWFESEWFGVVFFFVLKLEYKLVK